MLSPLTLAVVWLAVDAAAPFVAVPIKLSSPNRFHPVYRPLGSALGFMIRVVGGSACGAAVGAIAGLLLTAVNNLVLARRFGAAEASYAYWAVFLAKLLLVPSVIASIAWGIAFLSKLSRGPAGGG
jgi:NhaP-type Na+/H+ or K+/H+ antiporter